MKMLPYSVWWIFFIIGISNGDAYEIPEFDVSLTKIFSASLECSPNYRTTDKIKCRFHLKNNGHRDYSVLKWRTPLEELTSNCLSVTRNGKKIAYDGVSMTRGTPSPDEFEFVAIGKSVSSTFDVSEGYDMSRAGTYSIAIDTFVEYAVGSVKTLNKPEKPEIPILISHLSSPTVSFQVVGKRAGNGTPGQKARSLERENKRLLPVGILQKRSVDVPLDPIVYGNAAQKANTKEIHRASYHYIKSAISDVQRSPDRVETWFGKSSLNTVLEKFTRMESLLRSDTFTYIFGGCGCRSNYYAYTWKGVRKMHLCGLYETSKSLSGYDSKMSIVVHEFAHALVYANDETFSYYSCKYLAKSAPALAAKNAFSYLYFAATLFPFNYGFDAMTTWSNGYIYFFKDNMYVRYKDVNRSVTLDPAYPMLIQESWGNLGDIFGQGFDSFLYDKVNGFSYATRGNLYIGSKSTVRYPRDISTDWGVSGSMSAGFDCMLQLSDGKTYATKGPLYIRYSGKARNVVDAGYPKKLDGNWGNLPGNFKSGFDACAVLPNGKLYIFRGSQYIRMSNVPRIDSGYPKPIKGHWGNAPQ